MTFYLKDDLFYYWKSTERIAEVLKDQMWVIEANFLETPLSAIILQQNYAPSAFAYSNKKEDHCQ